MIRRPVKHRRNRRALDSAVRALAAPVNAVMSIETNQAALELDKPVSVNGIPQMTANGELPTGVTIVDQQHLLLTYAANVTAGQTFVFPANDPAIKSAQGGLVSPQSGTF